MAVNACSQITVSNGNTVLFGNNEDANWGHPIGGTRIVDAAIFFAPPNPNNGAEKFGAVFVGWFWKGQHTSYQGGMNDQGLSYDMTAVDEKIMENEDKPYDLYGDEYFFAKVLNQCANVSEVVELFNNTNFQGVSAQFQFSDANGESVVISPDENGAVIFTYKAKEENYQFSTALANQAFSDEEHDSAAGKRTRQAAELVKDVSVINVDLVQDVLMATSQRTGIWTMYSNIFDAKNLKIYLYYPGQWEEVAEFDLREELDKSYHSFLMKDLFSESTVKNGFQNYYRTAGPRVFAIPMVIVIGIILMLIRYRDNFMNIIHMRSRNGL
jgi:hypothetical protein